VFFGSGSFAFPAPRSFLPVARLNLRGFPLNHRLLLTSLRLFAGSRPSWASLLSRTEGHRCHPAPSPPVGVFRPPLLRFVGARAPIPFHRLHPRRPPSRSVSTTSDSSSKLESRSDPVVSHDFVGFLRRLLGFSPSCSSPFTVTKDLRIYCAPLPIVGFDAFLPLTRWGQPRRRSSSLTASVAVHSDSRFPASTFVPLGGFPPLAAGVLCSTPSVHVSVSLASSDFSFPSIRDLPDESVSSFTVVVVPKGRRPSRLYSASGSVPSNTG